MTTEQYRLPSGEYTTDRDAYIDTWRSLVVPVADHLGWNIIGYDPGCTFTAHGVTVEMTVAQVQDLAAALAIDERLERCREVMGRMPTHGHPIHPGKPMVRVDLPPDLLPAIHELVRELGDKP